MSHSCPWAGSGAGRWVPSLPRGRGTGRCPGEWPAPRGHKGTRRPSCVGAGQVLRGTRTPLALSQRLSPAPTQCPCVQPLGKVPVPFRQGLGTLLQPHLWGHSPPRGQAHPEAFWCPFGVPWQNRNPTVGRRRGLVPSPSTRDWGASQRFIYLGTNSLFQAFFCSSLFNPSLTRAHSHAFLRQKHTFLLRDRSSKRCLRTLHFGSWRVPRPPHISAGAGAAPGVL